MSETTPSSEEANVSRPVSADAEQRVEEIADLYLDRLQSGESPDRGALVAEYPELAELLEEKLAFVEKLFRVARKHKTKDAQDTPLHAPAAPALNAETICLALRNLSDGDGDAISLPERIGRYLVREFLGRGSWGTVYRAYDPKLDREVALKILRPTPLAGPDFARRFHREARIAAQLRHPHIVPVHETGEHEGQPFIVMDHVRGQTLAARLASGPIAFKEAAELIRKAAEALDYAHGFGIIHRDVKPSNILLDERGEPQLIDFGLARHTAGGASITEQGRILGTPDYMSPEQARGGAHEADQRTDVYSLGAVLYHLLTGRVPFPPEKPEAARDDLAAQVYRIIHTDLVHPRKLNPAVPRDLETICCQAMAKEPGERFASATALAEELRRWLDDEPLRIRPPTWWERTRRWCRRRPAVAALTAAVFLVMLAGLSLFFWQWRQAEAARGGEAAAKEKAEQHFAQLADAHLHLAEVTQAVSSTTEAIQLYQQTWSLFDQLVREQPTVSDHRFNAAQVQRKLGTLYYDIGQMKEAETAFRTALEMIEPLAQEHPDKPRHHQVMAQILADLGRLYGATKQPAQAKECLTQALAVYTKLVQDQPEVNDYQRELALVHNRLGVSHRWEPEQALDSFREALRIQERLVREYPENLGYRSDLANTLYNLGNHWCRNGPRLDQAEAAYVRSRELGEELVAKHPLVHPYQLALAKCLGSLAGVYQDTSRPDQAAVAYRRAMSVLEELIAVNPTINDYARTYAVTAAKLAELDSESPQGKVEWCTKAIAKLEGILKRDQQNAYAKQFLAGSLQRRARALTDLGRHTEALRDWDRALEGAGGGDRDALRLDRAISLAHLGNHARAIAEVNELAGKAQGDGEVLYHVACVHALSSAAALQDNRLPPADRALLAEQYAAEAVKLLEKARAAGYFRDPPRIAQLTRDVNLDPLRSREDFRKLAAALRP